MTRILNRFFILLAVLFSIKGSAQTINFISQAEVDAFNPSITSISGNLIIGNLLIGVETDIWDLSNLSNLQSIGGKLDIRNNPLLTNIDGLSNLSAIGYRVDITNNIALENLDGLQSVTSIPGAFFITKNISITNVLGLSNLTFVGGFRFSFLGNNSLKNLKGLEGLTSLPGELSLTNNISLESLEGLNNLTQAGDISITNQPLLHNIDALSKLEHVEEDLYLNDNHLLQNVDGLSSLKSIGTHLRIINNDGIMNLDGLSKLESVDNDFVIAGNASLTDCCGIAHLLSDPLAIGGNINVGNNPSECSSIEEVVTTCDLAFEVFISRPCIGSNNGAIQIDIVHYQDRPFSYQWEQIESGANGSGITFEDFFVLDMLEEGTYSVTITNPTPDTAINSNINLLQIPGSTFEILEINTINSSNGLDNGTISIEVTGGTAPYDLEWFGPSSGMSTGISNSTLEIPFIGQGTYDITISDQANNKREIEVFLIDEVTPEFPCNSPMDIIILNDVSGSVGSVEYSESQAFFVDFMQALNIGPGENDSRVGIVEWSSFDEQKVQIPITGDMASLEGYVNYNRSFDAGTDPNKVLEFAAEYLNDFGRQDIQKVLILSTDAGSGQVSPSAVAFAQQLKEAGFYIITIAFDQAFKDQGTRALLSQIASNDILAPGAPSYSELDEDLARNIVYVHLCPIEPGSAASSYFDRDGLLAIQNISYSEDCPLPGVVDISFTVSSLEELSIPAGTPVSFYSNSPLQNGATKILTWLIPCAIPAGEEETFEVTIPINGPHNIYLVLNDDGTHTPPLVFPLTDIDEIDYNNNIDNVFTCDNGIATLQATKYATNYIPTCGTMVSYIINVCNVSERDAFGVNIEDDPPENFVLAGMSVNTNDCVTETNGTYNIPSDCCVSLHLTYDASQAENRLYNDQDVFLSGPQSQEYQNFDGALSSTENVNINGNIDCESSIISFSKAVNKNESCDDRFLQFTFTIHNETNIPLYNLGFKDMLPDPSKWVYEPYNVNGLTWGGLRIEDNEVEFTIDRIEANTVAQFSFDATLGIWDRDDELQNSALLSNVPDFIDGGFTELLSNTTFTNITARPDLNLPDIIFAQIDDAQIDIDVIVDDYTNAKWSSSGDGIFTDDTSPSTFYILGGQDSVSMEVELFISISTACHDINEKVILKLERSEYDDVIHIPNIFSPNDDNHNDKWQVILNHPDIRISDCKVFDRWGALIFQSPDNAEFVWDGNFDGSPVSQGVYIYYIKFIDNKGVEFSKVGDITLIR